MLYALLKRIYDRLPLTPGQRYSLGAYKRRLLQWWRGQSPRKIDATLTAPTAQDNTTKNEPSAPRWTQTEADGRPDYVFFGVIDWHFRHQRPQQLAMAIADSGRRVFYVSVNFIDNDQPGFSIEPLHDALPLFQVFFNLPGSHSVYAGAPSASTLQRLRQDQNALWKACHIQRAVHVVQHPYWHGIASFASSARLVYDCMDFHAGFANTGESHTSAEHQLMQLADLTIVTSDYLLDFAQKTGSKAVRLIRNAGEFDHFHRAYTHDASPASPPVIGYYGAIAEWFDAGLIEALSTAFPQASIELVGDDTAGVRTQLAHCANVRFHGEKPYADLPDWLRRFDVCLIPFRITELTLATNPVKAYEYLSAGKPVVGTDLPELGQFGKLVYRAADKDAFVAAVGQALREKTDDSHALARQRVDFARTQTWQQRAAELVAAAEDPLLEPLCSVVVISYNQWPLTERCLDSIIRHSDTGALEIIVVDNASADDTPARLTAWAAQDPAHRKITLNAHNLGFGPAVNQGLAQAQGQYLVVLNNDTIVSRGWLRGLRRHFEVNPDLGIICPVTNNIGNEAQIALKGSNPAEIMQAALHYNLDHAGLLLPLSIAAFFCVMIPRHIYQQVGGLDEQFVPGFFEDDDYCLRVKAAGYKVGCAEDVFVYHELSASFDKLSIERRQAVFERNKALFEKKWGPWQPHVYRPESLH